MMKRGNARRLLLLLTLMALAACSGEPTAPPQELVAPQQDWGRWDRDDDDDVFDDADLRWIAKYKTKPTGSPIIHQMIGPEGGTLRLGDFEIIVPAGAVERNVNFSIRLPRDPRQAERAVAEFGPHMYFRKPVTIRLPASSTEVNGTPYVLWWAGFFWLPVPTSPTGDGRIEAKVWHFSLYGTSYWGWSRGWTTAGG